MINSFLFYEMTYITNSCCGRIAGNNISGMNIYKVSSAVFIIIINIAMKYFKRVIVFVHFSVSFYLILVSSAKKKKKNIM